MNPGIAGHSRGRIPAVCRPGTWLALLYLAMLSTATATADSPVNIVIVTQPGNERYQQVVQALRQQLDHRCAQSCTPNYKLQVIDSADVDSDPDADLLVTIGGDATELVARLPGRSAHLYGFIPYRMWMDLKSCCGIDEKRHSAVFIDQPLLRQLRLVRLIDPRAERVGVLLGPSAVTAESTLQAAAEAVGMQAAVTHVESVDGLGRRMRDLTDVVDILLALPDADIYNRNTIYSILLSSYSAGVPVIGYSKAMVNAGAAATAYAAPADAGRSIADAIAHYIQTATLPPPAAGADYSVAVNQNVIRSLRLSVFDENTIARELQESER